jgi:hypothetical protein
LGLRLCSLLMVIAQEPTQSRAALHGAVIEASNALLIVAGTYYKNHERILALNERQLGAYPCEHQTMACASVISAIGMRRSSALQWQQVRSR